MGVGLHTYVSFARSLAPSAFKNWSWVPYLESLLIHSSPRDGCPDHYGIVCPALNLQVIYSKFGYPILNLRWYTNSSQLTASGALTTAWAEVVGPALVIPSWLNAKHIDLCQSWVPSPFYEFKLGALSSIFLVGCHSGVGSPALNVQSYTDSSLRVGCPDHSGVGSPA